MTDLGNIIKFILREILKNERHNIKHLSNSFPKNGCTRRFYPQIKTLDPHTAAQIGKLVMKELSILFVKVYSSAKAKEGVDLQI